MVTQRDLIISYKHRLVYYTVRRCSTIALFVCGISAMRRIIAVRLG